MTGLAAVPAQAAAAAPASALGDLSLYEAIAKDTLALVTKGDLAAAQKRITDFETAWDDDQPDLRPRNVDQWGVIDDAADRAIAALRAGKPVQSEAKDAVAGLIAALQNPAGK
ncbi:hypothetical protein DKG75_00360 [Zavarzinia compransoris]|uniref:Histidine kinase n=2 Tax=Zavarzinia compransoris TaxID=1264899 RepID=A0A317EFT5_9PROT|nr:hypothetical protein DKG75_00360 [Zavarzinia compransoris]